MVRTPVFDVGDTLLPSRAMINQAVKDHLAERGVEEVPHFTIYEYNIFKPGEIKEFLDEYGLPGDAEEIKRSYEQRFESYLEETGKFQLFRRCSQELGVPGLISDNSIEHLELWERLKKKRDLKLECIVVSEKAGAFKPSKEIFQAFLECRGEEGEGFAYFGNNAEVDAGCEKAGMEFIWVKEHDLFGSNYTGKSIERLDFENVREAVSG